MSTPLQFLVNFANIPRYFHGDIADTLFDEYFDVLVYFEVLYVLLVYYVPPLMKDRAPLNLRGPFIIWNTFLTLFSLGGFIGCSRLLMFLVRDRGFYETTCHFDKQVIYDGEQAFWLFIFLLSKVPEMIDTVFLVLQKKPIIFLHWYHHLTVTIFCWYAGHSLIPSGIWFATMNYGVHSVMYFYYLMCACGLRKLVRPFAPLITGAQLLQMVAGTAIVMYTFYHSYISSYGCDVDRRTIRMGVGMYGSYFVLFAGLFARLYLRKGKAKGVQRQRERTPGKAADQHTNGVAKKSN